MWSLPMFDFKFVCPRNSQAMFLTLLKTLLCSSFIQNWVVVGRDARLWTKAAASKLSFDQQCKHCEKVTLIFSNYLIFLLSF